jgi:hypothetical protein
MPHGLQILEYTSHLTNGTDVCEFYEVLQGQSLVWGLAS